MQMTGKLEETKSKAAIINRTKRRLGGAEKEFKAGMGNFGGDGGEGSSEQQQEAKYSLFSVPAKLPSNPRNKIKSGPQKVAARERRGKGGGSPNNEQVTYSSALGRLR